MKAIALLVGIFLGLQSICQGQDHPHYPDGTIVFSYSTNIIGRIAKRITKGDHYTHVGIVIDGMIYESDWPRAKRSPIRDYGKRKCVYDFYVPLFRYTEEEVDRMRRKAKAELGKPYQLRNYIRPWTRKTEGTWCSPYVTAVLNATGYWRLSSKDAYEPQNLYQAVIRHYAYHSTIKG